MEIFTIAFFMFICYLIGVCQSRYEKRKLEEENEFYKSYYFNLIKENIGEIKDVINADCKNTLFIKIKTSENNIIYNKYTFNNKNNKWEYDYTISSDSILTIEKELK